MRILEFQHGGSKRVGVVNGDGVVDLTSRLGTPAATLGSLLVEGLLDDARAHQDESPDYALDAITFAPLLTNPGRVFSIGLNYEKKYPAGKQRPTPTHPPWFAKLPGTLVGHEQSIVAPAVSETYDYEAELVAVIGTGGRHIDPNDALAHVAGYTCMNDGSVREWQRHSLTAGKNFDRSGSIGPYLVTADEIDDPQQLQLQTRVDGEVRQDASTSLMLFSVAEIISYLSQAIELRPGDVIATGSPEGAGGSFDPPRFLVPGQVVEVEIESVGLLRNQVVAESDA